MTGIRIRKALVNDLEAVCRVHKSSIRGLCVGAYSVEQIEAWIGARVPEDYDQFLQDTVFWVAETEGVAGFAILSPTTGELHALYIQPEHVGGGIGTELLMAVESEAQRRGLSMIALNATLNSVSFYEEHDYSSLGDSINVLPSGMELPCVRMEKRL